MKPLTKEQILKRAIKKAEKNGWQSGSWRTYIKNCIFVAKKESEMIGQVVNKLNKKGWKTQKRKGKKEPFNDIGDYYFIFSHDFAKAFWGEEWPEKFVGVKGFKGNFSYWKAELQHMVLEKDPIQYLKEFL